MIEGARDNDKYDAAQEHGNDCGVDDAEPVNFQRRGEKLLAMCAAAGKVDAEGRTGAGAIKKDELGEPGLQTTYCVFSDHETL